MTAPTRDETNGEALIPALLEGLERIPPLADRQRSIGALPLLGSRCWDDRLLGPAGERPGALASIKLSVAIDHLLALRALILEARTIPVYAHMTLLRPAFESSVQVRWLIDPSASPQDRVARALGAAMADLRWQGQIEDDMRASGWTFSPTFRSSAARRAEVQADAAGRGLAIAIVLPTTDLLDDYGLLGPGARTLPFRYTSGVLHAQAWATMIGEQRHETVNLAPVIRTEASQDLAATYTMAAVQLVERALDEYEAYFEPRP